MWFVLVLIIAIEFAPPTSCSRRSTTITPIVYHDGLLGASCRSNTDCQGLVLHSKCRKDKCVCRQRYVAVERDRCILPQTTTIPPTTTDTTTRIYDSLLGDRCDSGINCGGIVGNSICLNGICVCRSGYVAIGRDRCVPEDSTSIPPSTSTTFGDRTIRRHSVRRIQFVALQFVARSIRRIFNSSHKISSNDSLSPRKRKKRGIN